MMNIHVTKEQLAAICAPLVEKQIIAALYVVAPVRATHDVLDAKGERILQDDGQVVTKTTLTDYVQQLLVVTPGEAMRLFFPDVSEADLKEIIPTATRVNGID